MADFVAVIKKAIDGLDEASPERRERVYEKARTTIAAKLAAVQPPPSAAVIDRQKGLLEQAIRDVEAEYAAAEISIADDLDAVIDQLSAAPVAPKAETSKPEPPKAATTIPETSKATTPPDVAPAGAAEVKIAPAKPVEVKPETPAPVPSQAKKDVSPEPMLAGAAPRPAPAKKSGRGGLIAVALIALAFLGAAGYAMWLNKDDVMRMVGLNDPGAAQPEPAAAQPEPAQPPSTDTAEQQPDTPEPEVDGGEDVQKFTQKLNADGTETDSGPAGGEAGVGEGTSVAELTVPAQDGTPGASQAEATPAQPAAPETAEPSPAVAVGQRVLLYEENAGPEGSAPSEGSAVWSLVRESPGNDLPPEPAIRAEATVPGKDLQLRMTIRRNADTTLPASHIIELIFLTPEDFEGGVIDSLMQMTFKQNEQEPGTRVLGSAVKIGDGFFMIALGDTPEEIKTNMELFRTMKWIDIPIAYRSGRRALISLERGIPGDKVFEDALAAWAASSG